MAERKQSRRPFKPAGPSRLVTEGVTLRMYVASQLMGGMLANARLLKNTESWTDDTDEKLTDFMVSHAVAYADALIARLHPTA